MRLFWNANAYPIAALLSWLCYMLPGQTAPPTQKGTVCRGGLFKAAQTGVLKLGLGSTNRDGYLYVPPQYDSSKASSFILAIHAAGKSGMDALQLLYSSAASSGEACQAEKPMKGRRSALHICRTCITCHCALATSSHAGLNLSGPHMHPPSMLTANG